MTNNTDPVRALIAKWRRETLMACARELESAISQQPASAGEEIMVNAAHDVFILPLQPSGLSSGPRFVVHVPAPEQHPAEVYIDFPQVGTSGPFPVINGKVTLPDVTMNDLIRYARTGYVEQPASDTNTPYAQESVVQRIQQAMNELRPPEKLSETKAEYWKAGARAAVAAVNAALRAEAGMGDGNG